MLLSIYLAERIRKICISMIDISDISQFTSMHLLIYLSIHLFQYTNRQRDRQKCDLQIDSLTESNSYIYIKMERQKERDRQTDRHTKEGLNMIEGGQNYFYYCLFYCHPDEKKKCTKKGLNIIT